MSTGGTTLEGNAQTAVTQKESLLSIMEILRSMPGFRTEKTLLLYEATDKIVLVFASLRPDRFNSTRLADPRPGAATQNLGEPQFACFRAPGHRPVREAHTGRPRVRSAHVHRAADRDGPGKHVRGFLRLRTGTVRVRR